jgi:hypothetical protein
MRKADVAREDVMFGGIRNSATSRLMLKGEESDKTHALHVSSSKTIVY